ncbi:MAG: carboxypeptidase regulatory-like domain-containing protein [Alphaproteobacteria bacterium]|nr:carboxypeptidase regulatory-like domain-containing protein [Alphaproteobacteria bacterium]MCB9794744.1 carboxypeptidase regulatory-like domain-containing protein [Alphaproteobacteria bacterium]
MRRLLKLLAALLGLALLLVLGCAGVYLWRVVPPSGSSARSSARVAEDAVSIEVSGVIVDAGGLPAPGVWVGGGQPRSFQALAESTARSAADGSFSLRLSSPGPVRVMGLLATPGQVQVTEPVDDLLFTLAPRCALSLSVHELEGEVPALLEEPGGAAPIPGALVWVAGVSEEGGRSWGQLLRADEAGQLHVDPAPCGEVALRVAAEGHVSWLTDPLTPEGPLHVGLPAAALIDGLVTDEGGQPLPDASIYVSGADANDVSTDEAGRYQAWVHPARVERVTAWKEGYTRQEREVRLAPDSPGTTLDFQLALEVEVEVFCEGLPEDSCEGIEPLLCTHPLVMLGETCNVGRSTRCLCPGAPAAVRGGGRVARVEPGQREVWLDFSDGGEVIGEVRLAGEPATSCRLDIIKAPDGIFEDIGRGMLLGRRVQCDEEGRFEALGLPPGTFRLEAFDHGARAILAEVEVREGEVTDVGVLHLGEGSVIEGFAFNGLTGEPAQNLMIMVALAHDPLLSMPVNGDNTDAKGHFEVRGLPPGDYRVFAVTAPFSGEELTLGEDDVAELELHIGDDALSEGRGFSFVRGGAGELLVSELHPEGLAARSGLREGDVVVGAELFGLDLARAHPDFFEEVLARYSGPGLTLQVDRGGSLTEVELE